MNRNCLIDTYKTTVMNMLKNKNNVYRYSYVSNRVEEIELLGLSAYPDRPSLFTEELKIMGKRFRK